MPNYCLTGKYLQQNKHTKLLVGYLSLLKLELGRFIILEWKLACRAQSGFEHRASVKAESSILLTSAILLESKIARCYALLLRGATVTGSVSTTVLSAKYVCVPEQ